MKGGPHYALMRYLINIYKIPVTRRVFYDAIRMDISTAEKTKLFDFLFDNSQEVDANTQPDGTLTFLQYCKEDAALAEYFLKRGADPNLGVQKGMPSGSFWSRDWLIPNSGITLAHAILWGTVEVVELLVRYGATLEYAKAVHYAVERGDEVMLRKVLELGADIEQENEAYINRRRLVGTPLYRAVMQGKLDMVGILLEHGASVSGKGEGDMTYPNNRTVATENSDERKTKGGDGKGANELTVLDLVMREEIDQNIRDAVLEVAEPEYEFVVPP
jgi:ankyrin repeat protein